MLGLRDGRERDVDEVVELPDGEHAPTPASAFQSISPSTRWVERLIDARLQTAMLSRSCGRQISVQRFERWMVPVLVLRARLLIVSFHVSHGCDVVWSEMRIDLYCSRARDLLEGPHLTGLGSRDVLGVARARSRARQLDEVGGLGRVEEVPVVVVLRRAS